MIFTAYLCASTLVFLLVLVKMRFFSKTETQTLVTSHQLRLYAFKTVTLVLLGLVAFSFLSVWLGLLKFGAVADFNFPQDYIAAGLMGWLTLAVCLFGILSPIIATRMTGSH